MNRLFVYGTLLQGTNHSMAQFLTLHSTVLGNGCFAGKLYDVGSYPGAIWNASSRSNVHGQVVELLDVDLVLEHLDVYEGIDLSNPNPDQYERVILPVKMETGVMMDCYVYVYSWPVTGLAHIVSGDYIQHLNQK